MIFGKMQQRKNNGAMWIYDVFDGVKEDIKI